MNVERRVVSKVERAFVRDAILRHGLRVDGRRDAESRPLRVALTGNGTCEVQLGRTRVLGVVSGELVAPFQDRAHDGAYAFDVVLSPMASAAFPKDGFTQRSVSICRVVERTLRESGAIDTESLCVLAGSKVWSISVQLQVLDDAGNLTDACSFAALAALLHFRRPAVSVTDGKVKIHSWSESDPSALALHHTPVCTTFALLVDGDRDVAVVDPTAEEELVQDAFACIAVNGHGEVCSVQFSGAGIESDTLLRATALASLRAREMIEVIQMAVDSALRLEGNIGKRNLIAYLEAPQK